MTGITQIAKSYSRKHGISFEKSHEIVSSVLDEVVDAIYDFGGVQLIDKFTLEVKTRQSHTGVDPRTGNPVDVPATARLTVRTGKKLKEALQSKYCD